jgi:hypothetical protein
MLKVDNYFDKLILFDGVILSAPLFEDNEMRISAQGFQVMPGHPLNKGDREITIEKATLIFEGVVKSVRTIHEYKENAMVNKFKPSYQIVDILTLKNDNEILLFGLEGIMTLPSAYVEWEIEAKSFLLEMGL